MYLTLLENRNSHFQVKIAIANYGRILFRDFDETFNQVFGRKAKIRGKILRELVDSPKPSRRSLIQTQRTLIVVEIKRRLEIGYEVVEEVAEKVNRLVHDKTLSVRTALVYDGQLSPRIEADRFFDFIIPADRLF